MRLCLFAVFLMSISACSPSSSSNIAAAEFYGILSVVGNSSDAITCNATWRVSNGLGTYIDLEGSDKVTCSDGTNEITLSESNFLGVIGYSASGLTYEVGRTYTVTLHKDGVTYSSTVTLPAAVVVNAPTASQNVTKQSALNAMWDAETSNGMDFSLSWSSGSSSGTQSAASTSDDGDHTLETTFTETKDTSGNTLTGSIPATFTMTRYRDGTFVSSGLKGGSLTGKQTRSVSINLVD